MNENHESYKNPDTSGSIIVADDQFVNQQGIRLNFMDIGLENRLEMFSNGIEVLNKFEEMFDKFTYSGIPNHSLGVRGAFQPVSLLLLDINMPIMSGMQVCKAVRQLYKQYNDKVTSEGNSHR